MSNKKKEHSRFRKYLVAFWILVLLPFVSIILFLILVSNGTFGELPTFEELENPKSNLASEIISSDQVVLGKYYVENRTNVHYADLSPNIIKALKATEDI